MRYSASSPAKRAFRPTLGRRFDATNTARRSTAGYSARTVPRFASPEVWRNRRFRCPRGTGFRLVLRRGLVRSDLLPREKSRRSRSAVEDGVSQCGNSGTAVYGIQPNQAYARIHGLQAVALRCSACNCV
ncbi:hypothetical protein AArc1_5012 (plasmid) [Natrarchaeobaculum sulfurireducens]|uniref:Uncharacterized protein n=1 Tax=Natrarchaeobaculum sulfurireducens TaxID=2044521 RepID=A0A346P9L8_9EURY|nr:hypothetical protein AArc1_5012 [Natrarchaeobaculum sulfurireducens]